MWFKIKDKLYKFKMACQRFKRGYSDSDCWNFNTWYLLTAPKLLRRWADKGVSYPALLDKEWQENEKKWHDTLIYMAELLEKADYEEYDGWLNDMSPEEYRKMDDFEDEFQKHHEIAKEYIDEHFDLIKKYFFDMWD